jgi:hypothetical protein
MHMLLSTLIGGLLVLFPAAHEQSPIIGGGIYKTAGVGGGGGTCPGCNFSTNLMWYFELEEASGTAVDAHNTGCGASGCDLTETSGTIPSATGKINNARDWEATADSEYLLRTDHNDLGIDTDQAFTFSVWVNMESDQAFGSIVSKDIGSGAGRGYNLYWDGGTDKFTFKIWSAAGTEYSVVWSATGSIATWYHVVAGRNATTDEIFIVVNNGTPVTTAGTAGQNEGGSVKVGAYHSSTTGFYDGLIDELAFWKRTLSATEIAHLYNSGAGRSYADLIACTGC